MFKKRWATLLMLCTSMILMTGCSGSAGTPASNGKPAPKSETDKPATPPAKNRIVRMETNKGVIRIEMFEDKAPITTKNFIDLATKGFYDGVIFHRVIDGFMIQGGDPEGSGMGGPGYSIKGEFVQNGVENDLAHTAGVLSMARSMSPDSAGSQFFIMHKDAPHLDGAYAAFGKVTDGMDTVNSIAECETDYNDMPHDPQIMKTVTVETFGTTYPEPVKI